MENYDISDFTDMDNSPNMDTSEAEGNDAVDFDVSENVDTESIDTEGEIEALDFTVENVSDSAEDTSDIEVLDIDEIDISDITSENELDEATLDPLEVDETSDSEEIEALEAEYMEESGDLPTNEVSAVEEEILELDQEAEEAEIQLIEELDDASEEGEEEILDISADSSGSDPDPLDYGDEELETAGEDISSVPIIDDPAMDIPELDAGDAEVALDSALSDTDDTEENEESDIPEINTELPGSYPNPLDYDEETDEEDAEPSSMLETEVFEDVPPAEIIDDIKDNENPDIPETPIGYPNPAEFEEETEEEDRPKVLVREITPEILESREADMEEVLDNYRENLRDHGVNEEAIESFIQEEREKMLREYESLDRGDKDPYIYHDPTDWNAVAAALSDSENIETAESDELPPSDDLSANPEEIDVDEPIEDEIDQPSSELAEEDIGDDLESDLDEEQETPEDVMEEDQDVIEPEDVDYDAVFQEMTPDELEEGYQDIELDEDPEQYTAVLESFENDTWEDLSLDDRKAAMEDMAAFIGDKIYLENPPRIEYYYNEQVGDYGGYRPGDNVLQVNEYMLYQADEAADTIAHELWHAHQHECADNPRSERDYQYRYNFQNYVRHDISPERYRSQLVEAEAYAFAGQIKTQLQEMQRMKG